MPARLLRVSGRVQGVFFRARAQEYARSLKLTGWVRNTPDDAVEIFAEGTEEQLHTFESWCHRGPPDAQVEKVEVTDMPEEHRPSFEIER
ncbi:MAG: acylphosphatase [Candidatus Peribacteraceae bacterium]|nr:acylphosphatase [Candidatus Peribacteraceae bacterium]